MLIIKQDDVQILDKADIAQLISSAYGGNTISNQHVISMLLSMLPRPPSKTKDAYKWLASAVGVKANDPRPVLKVLWAIDGYMYAADGHRIHRIATELANGCYDPKTLELVNDDDLKPYRFKYIFDNFDNKAQMFLPSELVRVIYNAPTSTLIKSVGLVHENKEFLADERYFLQAVNGDLEQTLKVSTDRKQIYGQSEHGDFVLMLCRFDITDFKYTKDNQ